MDLILPVLIFVFLALIYTSMEFLRFEFYKSLKFKTKKFISDPNKISNLISVVLAAAAIGLTFTDMKKISDILGSYVVQIIMIFLIVIILILFWMNNKNERILSLERQLDSETKGLWKEYGGLNKYQKDKKLYLLMKTFVKRYGYVSSVQRYRYLIYEKDNNTVISLHGLNHFINEGFDLNTVSQAYF